MKNKSFIKMLLCGFLCSAYINISLADPFNIHTRTDTKNKKTSNSSTNKSQQSSNSYTTQQYNGVADFTDFDDFVKRATDKDIQYFQNDALKYLNSDDINSEEHIQQIIDNHQAGNYDYKLDTIYEIFDLCVYLTQEINISSKDKIPVSKLCHEVYNELSKWYSYIKREFKPLAFLKYIDDILIIFKDNTPTDHKVYDDNGHINYAHCSTENVYDFCENAKQEQINNEIKKSKDVLNQKGDNVHQYIDNIVDIHLDANFKDDNLTVYEIFDMCVWLEEYIINKQPTPGLDDNKKIALSQDVYEALDIWSQTLKEYDYPFLQYINDTLNKVDNIDKQPNNNQGQDSQTIQTRL